MYKWLFIGLFAAGIALYFSGALELDQSGDEIEISIDREKARELGEKIKDKIED